MSLVASLLTALVRADGDALVLHTGECPYVVSPAGQTELASRTLTPEAMTGVVGELLPPDARHALDTVGAVQHDLRHADMPAAERFAVVAARGGDDIWVEIRRHRDSGAGTRTHVQTAQVDGLDRLLRIAAERGASTMYLTSQGRPCIRVEGEIRAIEEEGVLSEADIQALMNGRPGPAWVHDIAGVGRVRYVRFTDHRGAGAIFRMVPDRAISAEQLRLPAEIRDMCAERDGLVLVAGPRVSGKSTLIAALIDLINRTRSEHVITVEDQITYVHVNRRSLVSQRQVSPAGGDAAALVAAALRERPDVLVIEDLGSPDVALMAVDAARSGCLVIGGLTATTTKAAVYRIVSHAAPDRRSDVESALDSSLRGVIAQLLVRKKRGGWAAAREVWLNHQLVSPMNDALAELVLENVVDPREAYGQAPDKTGLLAALARHGLDTSFAERDR